MCTNRGSEVCGFGAGGATVRCWLRVATPDEVQKLAEIAEAIRDTLNTDATALITVAEALLRLKVWRVVGSR